MTDSYYQMSDTCATCGERYGQHCGMRCPDKAGQFVLAAGPTSAPGSYHYPAALDDYFTRAANQANRLVFPSGACVLTSGDKIVGRVEAEALADGLSPIAAEAAASLGTVAIDEDDIAWAAASAKPEPIRAPLPHFNQRTEFDAFPDFVVFHEFEPTSPLYDSPTTDSAYPAIAGLLRG